MKRTNTNEPLTADDVAERLDRAAVRALRILMEVRQEPNLWPEVKRSRYLTNSLDLLAGELVKWEPQPAERARARSNDDTFAPEGA